ncbi:OmpA/MotB domain protein [Magnetococcus marinus MC-1]|uniref:OmpA/MotB domain protein n=1 Tax=Magnetococcus marinus (strain ATCC BAA-1437 / JCM 17883 / MC-1) TaxID=156889 RepID=A0L911_MAGMM|nr:flagellar motor protein MotB [Magnetococcus marinus]ABK44454.1 OmpA/MotB domain protein [Magnetococcus marinus MC-1]
MGKKCPPCKKGAPGWMVTFGDLMSLLLTFFVLLLSFAQLDIVKFEKVSGSMKDAFGVQRIEQINAIPTGNTIIAPEFASEMVLVQLREKVENVLGPMVDNGEAEMYTDQDGFVMQIDSDTTFVPGTLQLSDTFQAKLTEICNILTTHPDTKNNKIRIIAHTDTTPPPGGMLPTNWALSAAQAAAVVGYMSTQGGVDPVRLEVRAKGEFAPKESNDTADGRSKNRRIEILISRETVPSVMEEYVDDKTLQGSEKPASP